MLSIQIENLEVWSDGINDDDSKINLTEPKTTSREGRFPDVRDVGHTEPYLNITSNPLKQILVSAKTVQEVIFS